MRITKLAIPESNNLWATNELKTKVSISNHENDKVMKKDMIWLLQLADVKEMYTQLPHDECVKALKWVFNKYNQRFPGSAANAIFSINRNDHNDIKPGLAQIYSKYAQVSFEDIMSVMEFGLTQNFLSLGKMVLKQIIGVVIGWNFGPILAMLICIKREYYKNLQKYLPQYKTFQGRYVDDLLKAAYIPRTEIVKVKQVYLKLNQIYPVGLKVLVEEESTSKIKFLECEVSQDWGKLCISQFNKNAISMWETGKQKFKRYHNYWSHSLGKGKGVVIGALCRGWQNTNNHKNFFKCNLEVLMEFKSLGYPTNLLKICIYRMAEKTQKSKWTETWPAWRSILQGFG